MTWRPSRFRSGDLVEVRSKEEILATLDKEGRLGNLPFMPEMLQYCGRPFRVGAVAHKACDMVGQTGTARRLDATVHLEGLRCDGAAHGGCQAECNIFWRDAWLKPATGDARQTASGAAAPGAAAPGAAAPGAGCSVSDLHGSTISSAATAGSEVLYSCQATRLFEATTGLLPWWDLRQYLFDVSTRNQPFGRVVKVLFLSTLRHIRARIPFAYKSFDSFTERMHYKLLGRESPHLSTGVPDGQQTPTATLDLVAGEQVRIKPQAQIEQTLNRRSHNRGLLFDQDEMAPFCGKTFTVRKRVTQIIDEPTGRMLHMKNPCIMLEGVVCKSVYVHNRLNCPRAIPSYWREIWLERAGKGPQR